MKRSPLLSEGCGSFHQPHRPSDWSLRGIAAILPE
jgi:hypothetical protein